MENKVTQNTWTKGRSGDWLVRGPAGQLSGNVEILTVVKRDGTTKDTRIARQIWTDGIVALYAPSHDQRLGRSGREAECPACERFCTHGHGFCNHHHDGCERCGAEGGCS